MGGKGGVEKEGGGNWKREKKRAGGGVGVEWRGGRE